MIHVCRVMAHETRTPIRDTPCARPAHTRHTVSTHTQALQHWHRVWARASEEECNYNTVQDVRATSPPLVGF